MFSVITDQVIQECNQLEKQVSELYEQTAELEQAVKELKGLSGMDNVIAGLMACHSQMEFEDMVLRQMAQGLHKTVVNYMQCENRICDDAEQNVIIYERQEIGVNDFSGVTDILMGMETSLDR